MTKRKSQYDFSSKDGVIITRGTIVYGGYRKHQRNNWAVQVGLFEGIIT
jgi:hypothetical protein